MYRRVDKLAGITALERKRIPDDTTLKNLGISAFAAVRQREIDMYRAAYVEWLTMPVMELLPRKTSVRKVSQVNGALMQNGYWTRRDLLVAGRQKIWDTPNLGEKAVELIHGKMTNEFGVGWQERPSPEDIAPLADRLSAVSSAAIASAPLSVYRWDEDRYRNQTVILSVQDILDMASGTDEGMITDNRDIDYREHQFRDGLIADVDTAKYFAFRYWSAQLALTS